MKVRGDKLENEEGDDREVKQSDPRGETEWAAERLNGGALMG